MFNPFTSPIIKKDLKVISRSMKFSWGLFAYEAVLFIVFLMSISIMNVSSSLYGGVRSNIDLYNGYIYFFPIVGITELIIIALIIPIITASSISGERERKTMDVLLTTTISAPAIILGKIGSAVIRVMTFIIASLPMLSLAFLVGGLSWLTLFKYFCMLCRKCRNLCFFRLQKIYNCHHSFLRNLSGNIWSAICSNACGISY